MKKYVEIPASLQSLIALRCGLSFICVLLLILTCIFSDGIQNILPVLAVLVIVLLSAVKLLYVALSDQYITVTGVCTNINYGKNPLSVLTKKIHTVTLQTDEEPPKFLTIFADKNRGKLKNLEIGDKITVYMAANTSLYGENNNYTAQSYYALTIVKTKKS